MARLLQAHPAQAMLSMMQNPHIKVAEGLVAGSDGGDARMMEGDGDEPPGDQVEPAWMTQQPFDSLAEPSASGQATEGGLGAGFKAGPEDGASAKSEVESQRFTAAAQVCLPHERAMIKCSKSTSSQPHPG